jgi:hypothetical protein
MKVEGVKEAKADHQKNWAWARYGPSKVTPEKLVEAINNTTHRGQQKFKAILPSKRATSERTLVCS